MFVQSPVSWRRQNALSLLFDLSGRKTLLSFFFLCKDIENEQLS